MTKNFILYLAVSAIVTYLIRVLPLVLVKHKIQSRFVISFLYYVPYAVLTAMTIPSMFTATEYTLAASIGFVIAFVLALMKKSLVTVAAASCVGVFVVETILKHI